MKKVLADWHHGGLWESLRILIEDRLGWELYKPHGREWHTLGYWNYQSNNDPVVIGQLLEGDVHDRSMYGSTYKTLTFQEFLDTDIDIIIASIPAHEITFQKLIDDHKPNAKLVRQEGNCPNNGTLCKNIMSSVDKSLINVPEDAHSIYYHQEFDTKMFSKEPARRYNRIVSLMNCLPQSFPTEYALYKEWQVSMPDYEFRMHGIGGEDGVIDRIENLASAIKEASFLWTTKPTEQDAGHVTSNAMACGRPIITRRTDLNMMFDNGVLEHGVTAIDILQPDAHDMIRQCSTPEKWQQMSDELYRRWHKHSDFEKEALELKKFFEELV